MRMCTSLSYNINEGLIRRRDDGGFLLPSYQRGDVWTQEQKIRFIESLILNLPVGSYCVCIHENTNVDNAFRWELLDGQQRWTAIFNYVDDMFPVFGFKFSELTETEKRYFRNRQFQLYLANGLTEEEKYELFQRLAYGGTPNTLDDKPTTKSVLR